MKATPKTNLSPSTYECGADYQTFCKINGQLVQDNLTIVYDNNIIAGQTYNLAEIWNEIQDAMKAAYNLGTNGTKGPDITGLTNKQKNDYTTLSYYNDLLSRLKKSTVSGSQYIKALDFVQNLQNGVKEYQLDGSACNICNNSCQYCDGCENHDPCASNCQYCVSGESCSQSCSEGGCGGGCDNSCCMSGCWSCEAYWTY